MNTPKLTIFMPVYNTKEEYLREAIESILSQNFTDYEFLIINDGSTNNSKSVILSYDDSRIHYVENDQNRGQAYTRNLAIEIAKGEFMANMDSDDISVPGRLETQVHFLDVHPEYAVYSGAMQFLGCKKIYTCKKREHDDVKASMFYSYCIAHPTVIMRLSVVRSHNIRYGDFATAQDYSFFSNLIFKCKFFVDDKVFILYRWHEDNISVVRRDEQIANSQKIAIDYTMRVFDISYDEAQQFFIKRTERTFSFFFKACKKIEQCQNSAPFIPTPYIISIFKDIVYENLKLALKRKEVSPVEMSFFRKSIWWSHITTRRRLKLLIKFYMTARTWSLRPPQRQ